MRTIKKLLGAAYQPFRFAIVKPIENSRAYGRLMDNAIQPLKKFGRSLASRLLCLSKRFERCVVVRVDGGLGNQMMQYSLGRKVEKCCELPVYYDLTWFERDGMDINKRLNRNFDLESAFGIKLRSAGYFKSRVYRHFFKIYEGTEADSEEFVILSSSPRYLEGFCLKYRDDGMVRGEFSFALTLSEPNRAMLSTIEGSPCPVAVHVRRGDFIGSILEMTTPRYFRDAIALMAKNEFPARPTFFVFSDDLGWCRNTLGDLGERLVFVDNNDNDSGSADMYLMSRCRHFILSNSTFSYWAEFLSDLSPDKLVITPSRDAADYGGSDRLSGRISLPVGNR